jgi:hypothetical protein
MTNTDERREQQYERMREAVERQAPDARARAEQESLVSPERPT